MLCTKLKRKARPKVKPSSAVETSRRKRTVSQPAQTGDPKNSSVLRDESNGTESEAPNTTRLTMPHKPSSVPYCMA